MQRASAPCEIGVRLRRTRNGGADADRKHSDLNRNEMTVERSTEVYRGVKYCPDCGAENELRKSSKVSRYDTDTGEPVYEGTLKCPNHRKGYLGLFHYFRRVFIRSDDDWEAEIPAG